MVQASASTAPTTMHFSARCSRSSAARASKSALAAARGRAALEPPGHRKSRQDRLLSLRAAPRAGSGSRGSGRRWRRAGGGEGEGEGESREGERGRHRGVGSQERPSGREREPEESEEAVASARGGKQKIPRGFFANTKYYRISPSLYVIKY